MSLKVLASLALACSFIAIPVFAQTLTSNSSVTISAVVPDYAGSPAQVIIPSMASITMPNVSANVTITNEGTEDYEYFYEWCVVSNPDDTCGSGNNTYYASASKLILMGQTWNTVLTATVLSPGTYVFKVNVFYGVHSSSTSVQFTTTGSTGGEGGGGGSSGGSGGGGGGPTAPTVTATPTVAAPSTPLRGDFDGRGVVDIVDFSILLYYWGAKPPFKNPLVDLNHDGKIDSVDFSILLYLWGSNKTPAV